MVKKKMNLFRRWKNCNYLNELYTYLGSDSRRLNKSRNYEENEDEEDFDIIFYNPATLRAYHFSPFSIVNLFLFCDYELAKIMKNDSNYFFKLKGKEDDIFALTEPDSIIFRVEDEVKEVKLELNCYSSLIFYRDKKNGRIRHLSLEEINALSSEILKKYLSYVLEMPKVYEQEPTYIL